MFIRFITALLSSVFLSLALTVLFNDSSMFIIIFVLTGTAYLLGGISCSYTINKITNVHWLKFIYFIIAGFIVGIITMLIFISTLNPPSNGYSVDFSTIVGGLKVGLYGSIGALIFYVIESTLNGLKNKLLN